MAFMCRKDNGRECDGCGDCRKSPMICPVCGEKVTGFYRNNAGIPCCKECVKGEVVDDEEW